MTLDDADGTKMKSPCISANTTTSAAVDENLLNNLNMPLADVDANGIFRDSYNTVAKRKFAGQ